MKDKDKNQLLNQRILEKESSPSVCMWCVCGVPALWVVHEEQVEQSVSGIRQPGEFILQVVVRLLPQTVLTNEGQPGETLRDTHKHTH